MHHKEGKRVQRTFPHHGRQLTAAVIVDVFVLAAGNRKRPQITHELIEFTAPDGETRGALLRAGEFARSSAQELGAIYAHAVPDKAAARAACATVSRWATGSGLSPTVRGEREMKAEER